MCTIRSSALTLTLSESLTRLCSIRAGARELLAGDQPLLFSLCARDEKGAPHFFTPDNAQIEKTADVIVYRYPELTFRLYVEGGANITWRFAVENHSELSVEYVCLPEVVFAGTLRENGGDCAVVSSYNEGLLVEDWQMKTKIVEPEYPSRGWYMMYPYMLFAPLTMWLYGSEGIAMYVADPGCGAKNLDFACTETATRFCTRIYLGGECGGNIEKPISIVWAPFRGDWHDGAEIYRQYVYENIAAKPLSALDLPKWYTEDMPLVITYPIRGQHDMDEMTPNKLFPYTNVLPLVDEFAARTGCRIMVLLMHWEGTAPWAPPYVWPPYGGEEGFNALMDRLHADGHLLGVYCSGYSFTKQSNLIAEYNCEKMIADRGLTDGFCLAPNQELVISDICPGQRSGYDICAASPVGREILNEAYKPLLSTGVDYAQALDQNHGGGMYFCYSKDHGHPPMPGDWMTEASRALLKEWKDSCPETLLGCESAAAEPYIENLRLSDNRYELCYRLGQPIPLYAYLYHRYLHNFMGNQVDCQVAYTTDGLMARIGYSFAAGDLTTLVLNDDGEIMFHWGMRDFSKVPDRDAVIAFCKHLHTWHTVYPTLFCDAEMIKPLAYKTSMVELPIRDGSVRHVSAVYATAWRLCDKCVQLFVNHTAEDVCVELDAALTWRDADAVRGKAKTVTVPARSVIAVEF